MKTFVRLLFLAFLGLAAAMQYVHMENSLFELRDDFTRKASADEKSLHEVVFAIKQNNLPQLEKTLFEVSDPTNPKYGKYLTREQVGALTENRKGTDAIHAFLKSHGAIIIKTSPYGEYVNVMAPISLWQQLFATTFYDFEHVEKKTTVKRCLHYSVPQEIAEHVEAVFNTVQLPLRQGFRSIATQFNSTAAGSVTPSLLNSYYHISSNTGNSLASQSLYESLEQYYSPADLTTFQKKYNLPVQAVAQDIGGYVSDSECVLDANNCAEANLDVQYIMAVAQSVPTTYWYDGSNDDTFLSWIQAVAETSNPPLVHSISYGAIETELAASSVNSFNTEAMKLGTQGVSILASSGDDGVANFIARNLKRRCGYTPSFPASSPYVTAVGATQGPESGTTEIACTSDQGGVITTGGGFSTISSAPSYQTSTISKYFSGLSFSQKPVSGYSTTGRGYPDVAMAGFNYEVTIGGKTYALSGTSASSPVVAGMVSLVNSARLKAGKPALGFLNPAIYQYGTQITNDVTSGKNNCAASSVCCDQGFYATAGWDPLTGFGSVDYAKFSKVFSTL